MSDWAANTIGFDVIYELGEIMIDRFRELEGVNRLSDIIGTNSPDNAPTPISLEMGNVKIEGVSVRNIAEIIDEKVQHLSKRITSG